MELVFKDDSNNQYLYLQSFPSPINQMGGQELNINEVPPIRY